MGKEVRSPLLLRGEHKLLVVFPAQEIVVEKVCVQTGLHEPADPDCVEKGGEYGERVEGSRARECWVPELTCRTDDNGVPLRRCAYPHQPQTQRDTHIHRQSMRPPLTDPLPVVRLGEEAVDPVQDVEAPVCSASGSAEGESAPAHRATGNSRFCRIHVPPRLPSPDPVPEQEHVISSQVVDVLRALHQHQLREDRDRLQVDGKGPEDLRQREGGRARLKRGCGRAPGRLKRAEPDPARPESSSSSGRRPHPPPDPRYQSPTQPPHSTSVKRARLCTISARRRQGTMRKT